MAEDKPWSNPFAKLERGNYPDGAEAKVNPDGELFRETVRNMRVPDKDSRKLEGGFSLRERGVILVDVKPGKKRGHKKKGAEGEKARGDAKLPPKPAPISAPEPSREEKSAEAAIFLLAMADATPLKPGGRMVTPARKRAPAKPKEAGFEDMLEETLEFALLNGDEYVEGHVAGLDENIMNSLRAGAFNPEAHLDLHGLNSLQAFEAVRDFIRMSWFKGLRSVLIVPGRGLNSPDGRGVLRRKLLEWLPHEPFRRVVLAFCTAQPRDGGPGSIYVLLRGRRKKGRIHWESLPPDPDLYL